MKAIMVEDVVKVTREPSDEAISIMSLKKGDIVETGKVTRKKKSSWVQVILPGGQTGYISGQTRIFVIRQVELAAETNLLSAPTETAAILKSLPKGSILSATGVVDVEVEADRLGEAARGLLPEVEVHPPHDPVGVLVGGQLIDERRVRPAGRAGEPVRRETVARLALAAREAAGHGAAAVAGAGDAGAGVAAAEAVGARREAVGAEAARLPLHRGAGAVAGAGDAGAERAVALREAEPARGRG